MATPLSIKVSKRKGLSAQFILKKEGATFLGQMRVALLEKILQFGSINRAAKEVGITYKTAWDSIDAMNNLADQPLVVKSIGGKNGGGTKVTQHGIEFIRAFKAIDEEYQRSVVLLSEKLESFSVIHQALRRFGMATSARNQFAGKITRIEKGAVNSEIKLEIDPAHRIICIIPNSSMIELRLKKGSIANAIFKTSSVMITTDEKIKISARNRIGGTIGRIEKGAVYSEITVEIGNGKTICATISNRSVARLGLRSGIRVHALIKASSVLIGVTR